MTKLTTWQATIQDDDTGAAIVSPVVTIRLGGPAGALADLFDIAGSPLGVNPVTGGLDGFVQVQMRPGRYWVQAADGGTFSNAWYIDVMPEEGLSWETRAELVEDVAAGMNLPDGAVVSAAGVQYVADSTTTAISDLPGWLPFGDVTPNHWGQNVTPGTTDMRDAIYGAVMYAISSQKVCRLLAQEYFISSSIRDISTSSCFGFVGAGSGLTKITCGFSIAASAIKFFNKTNFHIGGFELDGRFVADGSLVGQGVDLAHLTSARVHDIIVRDCEGQGCWVISGSSSITNEDVHISEVHAIDCGSSGVQIQGAKNSGISRSSAVRCGTLYATNGGSGSGVYFKVPVEDCYHDNNYAEDVTLGAFNVGSSYPGFKGKRLTFSNGRALNVKRGIRIGEVEDSVFSNFTLDLDGTDTDGLGDAVRCETGALNNSFKNISVSGVGSSRAGARFVGNAEGNVVEITSFKNPTAGAVVAALAAGCSNNQVFVTPFHDATSGYEVQNLGTGNSFHYIGRNRVVRKTVASGAITLESAADHRILLTPEGGAASDNLDNISGGVDGQRISLSTYLDANDIVVTASGNIRIADTTRSLDRAGDVLELVYSDIISSWVEVSFADNQS
jgi:hypothetical protein